MFGIIATEHITRKCVITLEGGYKLVVDLSIPKPERPIFVDEMERKFIREFNSSQPNAEHKAVSVHILRN